MGQFSAEKPVPPGSTLSGNQQIAAILLRFIERDFSFYTRQYLTIRKAAETLSLA